MSNFGGTRGAEYEFITQNHATSIQMKLARRACLERNISRCPDFICLDMSSAHRKTRLARLSRGSVPAAAPAAPRRAGHTGHAAQIHNENQSRSRSHAGRTRTAAGPRRSRPSSVARRRGALARARNRTTYILWLFSINIRIIMCGKAGKPSEFRARSRQKAPTPCTNELRQAFTSTARQDGFLERRERERESCLDT